MLHTQTQQQEAPLPVSVHLVLLALIFSELYFIGKHYYSVHIEFLEFYSHSITHTHIRILLHLKVHLPMCKEDAVVHD